jgi:membrane protein YdbS with pleckstrin-like domain
MEERNGNPMNDPHFSNSNIAVIGLPDIVNIETQHIEKKFIVKSLGIAIFWFVIILGIVVSLIVLAPESYLLTFVNPLFLLIVLFCGLFLTLFLKLKLGISMKYGLREKDIYFEKGWWFHTKTLIPFHRIQHVALHQSLLDRYLNLAQLRVFTAGGESSDLTIDGLSALKAEQIRNFILEESNFTDETE